MELRAVIVCDDVRYERGNKLTLVGCYNDGILFGPGEGPMVIPKLAVVYVVSGLRGVETITCRQTLAFGEIPDLEAVPLRTEPHDAAFGEHNFVYQVSPALFPREGTVTAVLELTAGAASAHFEHRFSVRRGASAP